MLLREKREWLRPHLLHSESGFALAGVLGVLLLVLLLSTIVITSVVSGLSTTASSRSVVQSQAAAEAGIDVARAVFASGGHCARALSGTAPTFDADVSYATTKTHPDSSSADWIRGCPTAPATWVRVVSVGTPGSANPLADQAALSRSVEGIFSRSSGASMFTLYSSRNVVTT